MSKGNLLGLFAETPLHPGAGQAADVVDLPVAREGATGLPHIPDTGLKGALRQWAEEKWPIRPNDDCDEDQADANKKKIEALFGAPDSGAGQLMISSARLLCLPVRRLDGPYAWVTTPYLLERLRRDSARCECALSIPDTRPANGAPPQLLMSDPPTSPIFLEEFSFTPVGLSDYENVKSAITPLLGADDSTKSRIFSQLAIMTDEEFAWFAGNALPVNARNKLDDNKLSENLWYEETIPPDALFYSVVLPRHEQASAVCDDFLKTLVDNKYLQIGGNETVGQGWVQLARHHGESNE